MVDRRAPLEVSLGVARLSADPHWVFAPELRAYAAQRGVEALVQLHGGLNIVE